MSERSPLRERLALALSFVVLVGVVGLVGRPAIRGEPVYLDRQMLEHRFMNDPHDLVAVFYRNSADYRTPERTEWAVGKEAYTYRPLTMLTLVATEVYAHSSPLVHHLVSFALFVAALGMLVGTLRALSLGPVGSMLVAALVGTNAAIGETWMWIDGRADLLAFVFAIGFAWSLVAVRNGGSPKILAPIATLAATCAALSKETAVPALVFSSAVILLSRPREPAGIRNATRIAAFAVVIATSALLVGRAASARAFEGAAGADVELDVAAMLSGLPRLVALALGSLLTPEGRAMRALAYELVRPLGPLEAVGAVGFSAALAVAFAKRSAALGAGLLGVPAALFPCVYVASTFWLGLDRYIALAILPAILAIPDVARETAPKSREWAAMIAAAAMATSLAALHSTAKGYAGPVEFADRMMATRPADPTGYLVRAEHAFDVERSRGYRSFLADAPDANPYPPIAIAWIDLFARASDFRLAVESIDRLRETHPRDPRVLALAVDAAIARRQLDAAVRYAGGTLGDRVACARARASLVHVRTVAATTAEDRAMIDRFLRGPGRSCP